MRRTEEEMELPGKIKLRFLKCWEPEAHTMGVAGIFFSGGGGTLFQKIFEKYSKHIQKIQKILKNFQKMFKNFQKNFQKIFGKFLKIFLRKLP